MKKDVIARVKERNWDNDMVRVLLEGDPTAPIGFNVNRFVNSIAEVVAELLEEVDSLQEQINELKKPAKKTATKKPATKKTADVKED